MAAPLSPRGLQRKINFPLFFGFAICLAILRQGLFRRNLFGAVSASRSAPSEGIVGPCQRRVLPTLGALFVLSGEGFFEEGCGEGLGDGVEFAEEVFEIGGGAGFEGGADFLDEV